MSIFLGNQQLAVLSRLNELAERHGLSPMDFSALLERKEDGTWLLSFQVPDTEVAQDRFVRMLAGLGITDDDTLHLWATPQEIYDTIEWALQKAPKPPARGR